MQGKACVLSTTMALGLWHGMALAQEEAPAPAAGGTSHPTTPEVTETPKAEPVSSHRGLLGPVRVGPSVAVGIPHPVTAAFDIVYEDLLSLSVSGGRSGIKSGDTEVEIRNVEATLRWFPFGGSFFLGAAYGNQGVVGKTTVDLKVDSGGTQLTVPTTIRLEIESGYVTPQLGWFARWDSGFVLGFDFGLQLPQGPKSELQTSFRDVSLAGETAVKESDDYKKNKKDVEDAAEKIGKQAIPYITLIRMGWLF